MQKKEKIHAYIDGANLYNGVKTQEWQLDYKKFRIWLKEKHAVEKAYIFLGFISQYTNLYSELQESGYILVFREVVYDINGKAKGNCDADIVLRVVSDYFQKAFEKCVLVTSDGDFVGLVKMLKTNSALSLLVSPAPMQRCSFLLRKCNIRIVSLDSIREKIKKKEKAPNTDGTVSGSSS